MASAPAHVQEISINKIRQEGLLVSRGLIAVLGISGLALFLLLWWVVRDLPRFDAAKLMSPALWVCAGQYALSSLAVWMCRGPFCKRCLGGLFALQALLLLAVLFVAGAVGIHINFANFAPIGLEPAVAWLLVLLSAVTLLYLYWAALSPALAAIRLLATRLPPDDVPLTTVMATLEQTRKRPRARTRLAARAQALRAIGLLTWLAAFVLALRAITQLIQDQDLVAALPVGAVEFALVLVGFRLWRRSQRLAAVDANEELKRDPRAPILYLRSFQDDLELLEGGAGLFVQIGSGAPSAKLESARAQAWRRILQLGTGRLEESLAWEVRGIGPFVAIGAPTEPLPELGAARAYFSDDTWQSTIIRWIDTAGLIILALGPTEWIRWELDTLVERDALSKLIILMPTGRPEDRAARWQNVTSGLQPTRWASSLAMVDSETVIAIRFIDDGGLSIVTGGRRAPIDYLLAFRLMLYQMKKSAQ
jgi:hypothetical protein